MNSLSPHQNKSRLAVSLLCPLFILTACGGSSSGGNDLSAPGQISDLPIANAQSCRIQNVDNSAYTLAKGGVLYTEKGEDGNIAAYFDAASGNAVDLPLQLPMGEFKPSASGRSFAHGPQSWYDNTFLLFDLRTRQYVNLEPGLTYSAGAIAWSSDERFFSAATESDFVLVDSSDGSYTRLRNKLPGVRARRWSPDDKYILYTNSTRFMLLDTEGERIAYAQVATGENLQNIQFSPDGKYLSYEASYSSGEELNVFNIAQQSTEYIPRGESPQDPVSGASWSPSSRYMATNTVVSADQTAVLIKDFDSGESFLAPSAAGYKSAQPEWSQQRDRFAYFDRKADTENAGQVRVIDMSSAPNTLSPLVDIRVNYFRDMQLSRDGNYLALLAEFSGQTPSLVIIDIAANCYQVINPALEQTTLERQSLLSWSYSGKYLIYTWEYETRENQGENTYLVSLDGQTHVDLTSLLRSEDESDARITSPSTILYPLWSESADIVYFSRRIVIRREGFASSDRYFQLYSYEAETDLLTPISQPNQDINISRVDHWPVAEF